MKSTIEIITKEIGNVIEIEENVGMMKIPQVMGKDLKMIGEYLESNNVTCIEAPYSRYLDINWTVQMNMSKFASFMAMFTKKWRFMVGMPTSAKMEGKVVMKSGFYPLQSYVKAIHRGPYHKVGKTYTEMFKWLTAKGLKAKPESIEFYLNDPRTTKKEDLETMVLIPVE